MDGLCHTLGKFYTSSYYGVWSVTIFCKIFSQFEWQITATNIRFHYCIQDCAYYDCSPIIKSLALSIELDVENWMLGFTPCAMLHKSKCFLMVFWECIMWIELSCPWLWGKCGMFFHGTKNCCALGYVTTKIILMTWIHVSKVGLLWTHCPSFSNYVGSDSY